MENFLNLPLEIRNDILHNIRMQNAQPEAEDMVFDQ